MKIAIIAAHHIRFSPYIYYYSKILDEMGIEYDLFIPDKMGFRDHFSKKAYYVEWKKGKSSILNYYNYFNEVKKYIESDKYTNCIALTSISAVYLAFFLVKHFKNKYIIDIRDYTYEYNIVYYQLEKLALYYSGLSVISSPKFTDFLPKGKYYICHNLNIPDDYRNFKWIKPKKTVNISYIGSIAYKEQCMKLIDLVEKDQRFTFYLYGNEIGANVVEEYVRHINCNRIRFMGPYLPSEKEKLILESDILFNTYGNGSPLLDFALSNKLYDSLYYKKILLTSPNTFMEIMGGPAAFSLDYEKTKNLDALYNWIISLEPKVVQTYQDCVLRKCYEDNMITKHKIIELIKSIH